MQVKHKDIVQSQQLAIKAESLKEYISQENQDTYTPKPGRRPSKSRKEGGKQIAIETLVRKSAEKLYRRRAKRQTDYAAKHPEIDYIVEDIPMCAWWDWRW